MPFLLLQITEVSVFTTVFFPFLLGASLCNPGRLCSSGYFQYPVNYIVQWIDKVSTGSSFAHSLGRNGKFCIIVGQ